MVGSKVLKDEEKDLLQKSSEVEVLVNKYVRTATRELDKCISNIQAAINSGEPFTNEEIDNIILKLPVLMYWASDFQETVGIQEDVAKIVEKDALFQSFDSTGSGSVTLRNKAAEMDNVEKTLIRIIMQRAYKKIKSRVDIAQELLQSAKKISTRRMAELGISKSDTGGSY